jgi:ATP-dependent exoDNAse (exonuclease V) alpha subunit
MTISIEMPDGSLFDQKVHREQTASSVPSKKSTDINGFTPSRGQQQAFDAVESLIRKPGPQGLVITGYAGVGKTTMLRMLGKAFGAPTVIAPTGKAALRVSQASGLTASTAHRWLYVPIQNPKTGKMEFRPKPTSELRLPPSRLVFVDEASMIGRSLWGEIWRAAQMHNLKVVLIGDGFQLPPVEDSKDGITTFSTMTREFAETHNFERIELTEIMRQAADSAVVRASMALRLGGMGVNALAELPKVDRDQLLAVCRQTRTAGGVIIAHTNTTRFRVNAAMRDGMTVEPRAGEPLLVLRNNYDLDRYNGEQVDFDGWTIPPNEPEVVRDRYNGVEKIIHFAVAIVAGSRCVIALEQLTGSLGELGSFSVAVGAERWARAHGMVEDGRPLPFLEANYGYCYTAHKAQGSEWPYALVLLEPSVRLGDEEGRRWAYTAITRAKTMAAVFYGRP